MLERIHTGHMGVTNCTKRARDILFWPKMSFDIEEIVFMCNTCLEKRNDNPKEPLMPHEVPERPWQIVATDLFYWDGQDFVTIADYYCRYFKVYPLQNTLAVTVIQQIKVAFTTMGYQRNLYLITATSILAMSLLNSVNSTDLFTRRQVRLTRSLMVSPRKRYKPSNTYLVK